MTLDPSDYSEQDRPLVERAIAIARNHEDPYIQRDMEQRDRQTAGKIRTFNSIPHRKRQA